MSDIDSSSPADDDIVSQFPANERASRAAISTIFGHDHDVAPGATQGFHAQVMFRELAEDPEAAENRLTLYTKEASGKSALFFRDEDGNVVQVTKGGAIMAVPTGTKMLFAQASAPVGWTKDTDQNDRVLRVVSGTPGAGGSWTISGLSNGNTGSTTLTSNQMPPHEHFLAAAEVVSTAASLVSTQQMAYEGGSLSNSNYTLRRSTEAATVGRSSATGGGQGHTHAGPTISSNGAWRPAYLDVIKATKD